VPPAGSCGTAEDRMQGKENGGLYCKDWFFCMKPLPKEKVLEIKLCVGRFKTETQRKKGCVSFIGEINENTTNSCEILKVKPVAMKTERTSE
jgi:hypothetical protein